MISIENKILSNTFESSNSGDVSHLYWLPNCYKILRQAIRIQEDRNLIRSTFFANPKFLIYIPQHHHHGKPFSGGARANNSQKNPFYYFTKGNNT